MNAADTRWTTRHLAFSTVGVAFAAWIHSHFRSPPTLPLHLPPPTCPSSTTTPPTCHLPTADAVFSGRSTSSILFLDKCLLQRVLRLLLALHIRHARIPRRWFVRCLGSSPFTAALLRSTHHALRLLRASDTPATTYPARYTAFPPSSTFYLPTFVLAMPTCLHTPTTIAPTYRFASGFCHTYTRATHTGHAITTRSTPTAATPPSRRFC